MFVIFVDDDYYMFQIFSVLSILSLLYRVHVYIQLYVFTGTAHIKDKQWSLSFTDRTVICSGVLSQRWCGECPCPCLQVCPCGGCCGIFSRYSGRVPRLAQKVSLFGNQVHQEHQVLSTLEYLTELFLNLIGDFSMLHEGCITVPRNKLATATVRLRI